MKIAIVGGPSAGKTTTATAVVSKLSADGLDAMFVPEFALSWKQFKGRWPENAEDQYEITRGQIELERSLEEESRILVCDSSALLNFVYSMRFKSTPVDRSFLREIFAMVNDHLPSYDRHFMLPVREFTPSPDRQQTNLYQASVLQSRTVDALGLFAVPWDYVSTYGQAVRTLQITDFISGLLRSNESCNDS